MTRNGLRGFVALLWITAAACGCANSMKAPNTGFELVYLGRDAIFIENATLIRQGDVASFRTVRVQDSQFKAGETPYLGGYARSQLDCGKRTFQLLSFQSLKLDYTAGPEAPVRGDFYPIASGSSEEAMAKALCDGRPAYRVHAKTLREAVEIGRKRLDALD